MSDVFREVDEEVRREQLKKLWERYQALIVGAVLFVVVGVGGWRVLRMVAGAGRRRRPAQQFENAITLADKGKHAEAEKAFAKIVANGTPSYRELARIRQAAALATSDPAAATEIYEQISSDSNVEPVMRDLASLACRRAYDRRGLARRRAQALGAIGPARSRFPSCRARVARAQRMAKPAIDRER